MNKDLISKDGEVLAVSVSRFPTIFSPPRYEHEVVEGESETDTTLYEPLQSVVERCERAGMVRQLLAGAQSMSYDSKTEIDDDDLARMVFTDGDMLNDINITVDKAMEELLTASDNSSATKVAKKSKATVEALEESTEGSGDDVEKDAKLQE